MKRAHDIVIYAYDIYIDIYVFQLTVRLRVTVRVYYEHVPSGSAS